MAQLLIPDLEESVFQKLQTLAATHGRTMEAEAVVLLHEAIVADQQSVWAEVNAIRERSARAGTNKSDSADLIREDRDR